MVKDKGVTNFGRKFAFLIEENVIFTQTSISKVVQHEILCRLMLFFHDFSAKNSKKFDYYNKNMYTNSYFQMLDGENDSDSAVKTKMRNFLPSYSPK